jgi:hypothetical protein
LAEYASKTLGQREYLYAFRMINDIREAICKQKLCKFYINEQTFSFVPVSIETSPIYNHNYIIGIDYNNQAQAVRLSEIRKIYVADNKIKITKEMCELIGDHLDQIYEEEYNECSD